MKVGDLIIRKEDLSKEDVDSLCGTRCNAEFAHVRNDVGEVIRIETSPRGGDAVKVRWLGGWGFEKFRFPTMFHWRPDAWKVIGEVVK